MNHCPALLHPARPHWLGLIACAGRRPRQRRGTRCDRSPDSVRKIQPRQWLNGHRPHRSQGADRCGQPLVPRRLEERAAGPDGLRAPVRAPDVPGLGALRRRVLQAVRGGGRHEPERHDQLRPHQLLPERADHRARHGALDGVGPDGPPARRRHAGAARRATRGRAEREAPGREPPVRAGVRVGAARELPAGSSVPLVADRLDGGSQRRHAGRRP